MSDFDYGKKLSDGQHERHPSTESSKEIELKPNQQTYVHNTCGGQTRMPDNCMRTYLENPYYYGRTFCCTCKDYFPVEQFEWRHTGKCMKANSVNEHPATL